MKPNQKGYLDLHAFPHTKMIHKDPPVYLIENFLSHSECEFIIKFSENDVTTSRVVDRVTGQAITHPSRTSQSCYHGYILKWLVKRVQRLTGVPQSHQEPTQVARYNTGQYYNSHQDAFEHPTDGQRIGTVLIYLNNVENGGATFFNTLNLRVQPKEGSALVFFPSTMDGKIDARYLHTAENASDTKWVSQIWLRDKPYSC